MLTDRQETIWMYTVISSWDTRRCTWECIYAQAHTLSFFSPLITKDNQIETPIRHTHIYSVYYYLVPPSFAVTVLFNASANSVQPGRWEKEGDDAPSLCAPRLPLCQPYPPSSCGTCYHSLSSPAVVCFDWAKSTLSQIFPLHRHEHESQLSGCPETPQEPLKTRSHHRYIMKFYPSRLSCHELTKQFIHACTYVTIPQPLTHLSNATLHPHHQPPPLLTPAALNHMRM